MLKILGLLALIFFSSHIFSQSPAYSSFENPTDSGCNDMFFTITEQPPSLDISIEAFEDSLFSYLKVKKAFQKNTNIIIHFVITKQSQLLNIVTESGDFQKEKILKDALLKFSYLWKPAYQSSHPVCCFVRLEIGLLKDELKLSIGNLKPARLN